MRKYRFHCLALVILSFLTGLFWFLYLDQFPLDYTEYGEVDLVSLALSRSGRNEARAEALYRGYIKLQHNTTTPVPRVSLHEEIDQLPLEVFIRSKVKQWFPTDQPFLQFKWTNGCVAWFGFLALYFSLGKILSPPWALLGTSFFVSSFPLIAVGRISGRMSCFLSAIFVGSTILNLFSFLIHRRPKDLCLAGFWTGICFLNGLHSNVFIIPSIGMCVLLNGVFQMRMCAGFQMGQYLKNILFPLVKIIAIATVLNVVASIIIINWLGLDWRTHLSQFLFVNDYSRMILHRQTAIAQPAEFHHFLQQGSWYLRSFFFDTYSLGDLNHFEEFRNDSPLFHPVLVFLVFSGAFTGIVAFWRRWKWVPPWISIGFALVLLHITTVFFWGKTLPVRYSTSILLGYIVLGLFALKAFQRGLEAFTSSAFFCRIWIAVVTVAALLLSYFDLYSGSYFETGGNSMIRTVNPWAGAAQVVRCIKKKSPSLNLTRTAFVLDYHINSAILHLCLGGNQTAGYFKKYPILESKEQFLSFCQFIQSSADDVYFIFSYPMIPYLDEEGRRQYAANASLYPVNAMQLLFESPKKYATTYYNNNRMTSFTCYHLDLRSWDAPLSLTEIQNAAEVSMFRFRPERSPPSFCRQQYHMENPSIRSDGSIHINYKLTSDQTAPRFITMTASAKWKTQLIIRYDYGMEKQTRRVSMISDGKTHSYLLDLSDPQPDPIKSDGLVPLYVKEISFFGIDVAAVDQCRD